MRNPLIALIVFTALLFPGNIRAQQPVLDSLRVERIATACELWGHLKYFHPYLDGNSIDWGAAFADNIRKVMDAESTQEFGKAVQAMLDRLGDPATRVLIPSGKEQDPDTLRYPLIEWRLSLIFSFQAS